MADSTTWSCGPSASSSTASVRPAAVAVRDGRHRRDRGVDDELPSDGAATSPCPTTRCCFRASSTPTCTSTSRAAPSGRASRAPPAPPPPAASRRIVDMPLNSIPPTTTVEALELKRAAAGPQASVDVGFWGGAVPSSLGIALRALRDAGVFGFKAFLSPSGVDEFPHLDRAAARGAREIAGFGGLLIVHAEDPAVLDEATTATEGRRATTAASSRRRPDVAEADRDRARDRGRARAPASARTSCTSRRAARAAARSRRRRPRACRSRSRPARTT